MSPRFETIGRRLTGGDALPGWFSAVLYAALVWCATAGISALLLLTKNSYSPVTCTIIATVLTAAAFPFRPRASEDARAAHGPAIAAVAIALALLAMAGVSHSEHLLADRDPAVYINTARSIARTHIIHPPVKASPFSDAATFAQRSSGFTVSGGKLFSNFLNFLPALLALGWSAGGDTGLLLVPALLGALGMLALYALASSVVGPRWALVAPALLTLAPLQMWFARDAYAELPVEFLAIGGLWLFIAARRRSSPTTGAIAGVILGSITFARIDALGILLAIPAALAVEYLRDEPLEQRTRRLGRATIFAFAIAVGATMWLGLRVSHRLSPGYLINLHSDLHQLEIGFFAGLVGALGILVVHRVRAGIGHRIAQSNIVVAVVALLIVGVSAYAWHWRPQTGPLPSLKDGVPRKTLNAFFFSGSFHWFAWYFGTFTLAAIVIGFIVLGVRAARADSPAFLLLAAAAPMTVFYIARPSIAPDHLWSMRRYLPIVLPGMTIAAAAAALWATKTVGARWRHARAPFAIVVVAAMLVPAGAAGAPLLGAQMQGGALDAVHEICRSAGPHGAVAIEPFGLLALEMTQAVRGFCGIPSVGIKKQTTIPLEPYAAAWKASGRQLYVATANRRSKLALKDNAVEVAHVVIADRREPERVLGRRVTGYGPRPMEVWLYRIDAP
jgi:Dolichyl-phosphate-mannose-protein mannosyltransferase